MPDAAIRLARLSALFIPLSAAACAVTLAPSSSQAQRLNLGSDEPAPGSGTIAIRDAQALRESAASRTKDTSAGERLLLAVDALAATLLEQGEALGVPGSRHIAAARKLQAARPALSSVIAAKHIADPDLAGIAADLEACAARSVSADAIDAELRSAFAPLIEKLDPLPTLAAWPTIAGAPSAAWPDFQSGSASSLAEAMLSLEPLKQRLTLASKWAAFRPGAEAMHRLVRDAGGCFGRESKLPAKTYQRWLQELTLGGREILADTSTDAAQADRGLARLRRLAAWSRVLDALERHATTPAFKPITDALGPAFELMPEEPPPLQPGTTDRLTRLASWLESMPTREALQDDASVIRQLRPAFRAIADLCRASQSEAIDAVAAAIRNADAVGDPGVLAAVNMHRSRTRLLGLLRSTSEVLRDPQTPVPAEPTLRENAKPIADALLKLAKDVADPKQRDQAIDALSNLASDCADLSELPGERRLRERDPALDAVFGSSAGTLLDAIERERGLWRKKAASRNGPAGEQHAARLRALAATLALATDIADLESDRAALASFGGWTLGDADLAKLLGEARGAVRAFVAAASEADEARARDAARAADQLAARHAIVRVAATVCRAIRGRTELVADSDAARAAVSLLGICSGSPDPRWAMFGNERDALATIGRYATEARESPSAGEFANRRANEIMDRLKKR